MTIPYMGAYAYQTQYLYVRMRKGKIFRINLGTIPIYEQCHLQTKPSVLFKKQNWICSSNCDQYKDIIKVVIAEWLADDLVNPYKIKLSRKNRHYYENALGQDLDQELVYVFKSYTQWLR